MKHLIFSILLAFSFASVHGQEVSIAQQISAKEAELISLKQARAAEQAPSMFTAMATMTAASAKCVSDGIAAKGRFTRTAAVSKACREQAMLGAFAICSITVAQTGDTRDLNQCTAMMQDNGQWQQVWMRGLGIAGTVLGTREVGSILKGVVTPIAQAAISKEAPDPLVVRPDVVNPVVVDPVIVDPVVVEPVVIDSAPVDGG